MPADVIEIFSSIQGEGIYVGVRQIFLRLAGCNLSCQYCDTPVISIPYCRVEHIPGSGVFQKYPNPLSVGDTMDIISRLRPGIHHSISLTGGEPLLSAAFAKGLLPLVRAAGLPVYLETNGTLPDKLQEVISMVDIISMDIKIPTTACCGDYWDRHREFLKVAGQKKVFVKAVVTGDTSDEEIRQAAALIKDIDPAIPLVLQPATPGTDNRVRPPEAKRVIDIQDLALLILPDVRVIPQTHVYMGQL